MSKSSTTYSSHTVSFKLKVTEYAEKHGNGAVGREFTIPEFNVRYWRKQKQALAQTNASRKAFRGPKTGKFPQLEEKLLEYVKELHNDGVFHMKCYVSRRKSWQLRRASVLQTSKRAETGHVAS